MFDQSKFFRRSEPNINHLYWNLRSLNANRTLWKCLNASLGPSPLSAAVHPTQADTVSASQICWLFIWTWQNVEDYVSPKCSKQSRVLFSLSMRLSHFQPSMFASVVVFFPPEFAKNAEFSVAGVMALIPGPCCMLLNLKRSAVTQFVSSFLPSFCGQDILAADILIVSVWPVVRW